MDMEDKNDAGKIVADLILLGFRFHPTDEELVGFYLTRKVHQCSFPIELIKQVDIYKYDPWDLPKLASTGEKEWYFYNSRDRKYRNSTRPNRVTRSRFWKATRTDRPTYSFEGSNCIGLKKSLVFYRGKAAKGSKIDWMMHEFRLPSLPPSSTPMHRKSLDNSSSCQLNDSWAICRIFKKTKTMAQRGVSSQSWESSSLAATIEGHDEFYPTGGAQLCCPPTSIAAFTSPLDFPTSYSCIHKPMNVPPPTPACSIRPMPHFSLPTRC